MYTLWKTRKKYTKCIYKNEINIIYYCDPITRKMKTKRIQFLNQ
jgi:hypothetical protein